MKRNSLLLFFIVLVSYLPLKAQEYAASIKISTLGINLEGLRSFGGGFNARIGVAFFSYTYKGAEDTKEDYKYSADLKLTSISALADWFPFNNFLHITGGLLINLNKVEAVLTPVKTYTIGGDQYTPERLGDMNAKVKFSKVAPYIGIGYGNPTAGEEGFGFTVDIGTLYQGAPQIDLSAEGLLSPSAAPDQQDKLADNVSWFKWYPVVSFGLTYKF